MQKQESLRRTHCHQGSGPRHPPRKEVLYFPGKHGDQNPRLLFLRVAYCCLGILQGAAQKCSARIKVCAKCSQLETRHSGKSGKADFMFYFQNPDELYGSVGYYLQKGNVWWGGSRERATLWKYSLSIGYIKKGFLCMYIICLWFAVAAAAAGIQ